MDLAWETVVSLSCSQYGRIRDVSRFPEIINENCCFDQNAVTHHAHAALEGFCFTVSTAVCGPCGVLCVDGLLSGTIADDMDRPAGHRVLGISRWGTVPCDEFFNLFHINLDSHCSDPPQVISFRVILIRVFTVRVGSIVHIWQRCTSSYPSLMSAEHSVRAQYAFHCPVSLVRHSYLLSCQH